MDTRPVDDDNHPQAVPARVGGPEEDLADLANRIENLVAGHATFSVAMPIVMSMLDRLRLEQAFRNLIKRLAQTP